MKKRAGRRKINYVHLIPEKYINLLEINQIYYYNILKPHPQYLYVEHIICLYVSQVIIYESRPLRGYIPRSWLWYALLRCLLEFIQQLNSPRMHHQIMLKAVESGKALRNSILYNFAFPSILAQTGILHLKNFQWTVQLRPVGFWTFITRLNPYLT